MIFFCHAANENESSSSPPVSELTGFRRRHRSAMSPAALTPNELPWHGIDSRSSSEDFQAKLRSRHKSSIDDRRLTIEMDDASRDLQGKPHNITLHVFSLLCYEGCVIILLIWFRCGCKRIYCSNSLRLLLFWLGKNSCSATNWGHYLGYPSFEPPTEYQRCVSVKRLVGGTGPQFSNSFDPSV